MIQQKVKRRSDAGAHTKPMMDSQPPTGRERTRFDKRKDMSEKRRRREEKRRERREGWIKTERGGTRGWKRESEFSRFKMTATS